MDKDLLKEALTEFVEGAYATISKTVEKEAALVGVTPKMLASKEYTLTTEVKKGELGGYKQLLYSVVDKKGNRTKLIAVEFNPNGFVMIAKKTIDVMRHRLVSPNMKIVN